MNTLRRRRILILTFLFCGGSVTVALAIFALQQNINHFYLPAEVLDGTAPIAREIRAGGMVVQDSVKHYEEGLKTTFDLSDLEGSIFSVEYEGLLPTLFREGQGAIVVGQLLPSGTFVAHQVLAKHDENYVPPELRELHEANDP
ncbi:MAG: cytochrome c maturation protein CcmE [Gammaproteobacteria bacterium]|nr:cytochrome c maturation protein CcmE [Gammaproteobacteria bacterium]MYD80281.1 cytochrome c maturation protein CcmE [Gammaproteobacteria bacterium]